MDVAPLSPRTFVAGLSAAGTLTLAWLFSAGGAFALHHAPLHLGRVLLAGMSEHLGMGLCIVGLSVCLEVLSSLSRRSRLKSSLYAAFGLLLLTFFCSFFLFRDDLNAAARRVGGARANTLLLLMQLLFSLIAPAAYSLGAAVTTKQTRTFAALLGAGLLFVNQLTLVGLYPGLHFYFAGSCVLLLFRAFLGADVPPRPLHAVAPLAFGLLFGAVGEAASEPPVIRSELQRTGDVVLPVKSRAKWALITPTIPTKGAGPLTTLLKTKERAPDLPSSRAPVVVLLTVDALRADLLQNRKHSGRLPHLFRLQEQSVSFSDARSPAPATTVALASLFLGRSFSQLKWRVVEEGSPAGYADLRDDPSPRLGPALAQTGARVFGVAASPFLKEVIKGVLSPPEGPLLVETNGRPHASARAVFQQIGQLLREKKGPLFIYAHLMEPHSPYDGKGSTPFERYLSEVASVDAALGEFLSSLGELEKTLTLVLSSDHGEAFGEHGASFHASYLYDEFVRVPLLIRAPGAAPRAVSGPASTFDISATLYHLFGVPIPKGHLGTPLLPVLTGGQLPPERPLVFEAGTRKRGALFFGHLKLLELQSSHLLELYDLGEDPGERYNLFGTHPRSEDLAGALARYFEESRYREPGYETPFVRP